MASPNVKARAARFESDLARARQLFETIAINGLTNGAAPRSLRQPDRRDAVQFIFFEIAAKFEAFLQDLFIIEVRRKFKLSPGRSSYVAGSIDRGLSGVMGRGSPKQVKERGRNLFGANGFSSRLDTVLGKATFDLLIVAHNLRNRVAHDGADAAGKYRKALGTLQVPKKSRKGAGVGRVLLEYPLSANADDRWFHRFLAAYGEVAAHARKRL